LKARAAEAVGERGGVGRIDETPPDNSCRHGAAGARDGSRSRDTEQSAGLLLMALNGHFNYDRCPVNSGRDLLTARLSAHDPKATLMRPTLM